MQPLRPKTRRSSSTTRNGGSARCHLSVEHLEQRNLLALYPVANAGFEGPTLTAGDSWYPSVDGWSTTGVIGTTFELGATEPSPATEGNQFAYGDSVGWTLSQAGPVMEQATRYILSADVFPLSTGPSQASVLLRISGGTVLAGAGSFASANPNMQEITLSEGQWNTIRIGFNSTNFTSNVGQSIEIRIQGTRLAVDNVQLEVDQAVHDFYVSSSSGNAGNDGFNAEAPLGSFAQLATYFPLLPGERILLKAGDTFTEELNIRGKGDEETLVELSSYGEGPNPIIRRQDLASDVGVIWNNASYARITNIDVEHAKLGIFLRYEWQDTGSRNVTIEHCNFRDLSDPTLAAEAHNYEYAWSDAIFVGGQAWNQAEFSTRLENLTIRHVTSVNAAHLFGTAWYFPAVYRSRLRNLIIEDCVAIDNLAGAFQLFNVDGGHIKRVSSIGGGGQDTWSGTTLGFIQSSQNFLIEDNEFSYLDRAQSADGTGMDFEGDTHNVTFRNNVIHNNAGAGILILSSGGRNTNLVIEGNVLYNNARDPWNSEIDSEIQGSNDNHTGVIRNNGIYRGDSSINFFSPNSNWSGFDISNNRELEYADVRNRPTRWEFDSDGDFQGWAGFNQWDSAGVAGGSLQGVSSGVDPYVHSPHTWFNTSEPTYAWIRMSQTAGDFGQVFYITDSDPVWNAEKSVFFSIQPDGAMHDYFVEIGSADNVSGVITQIRLDPTLAAGSDMSVDFVRLTSSEEPSQPAGSTTLPAPLISTIVSSGTTDGHVLESAQNSTVGGSISAGSTTFRLGDDASNRAYRPVLSFDTSALPDNAIVIQATIGITRVGNIIGSIPIGIPNSQFGDILVDLATPSIGTLALEPGDWQAPATADAVSKFAWPAYLSGMTIYSRLEDEFAHLVSTTESTQFRVRYATDDDGDGTADYVSYASSNHSDSAYRPTLAIEYYVPSTLPGDYDLNNVVDAADYSAWKKYFGATSGVGLLADGNGDGVVNLADYTVWRDNLGAVAPVPILALSTAVEDASQEAVGASPSIDLRGMRSTSREDAFENWDTSNAEDSSESDSELLGLAQGLARQKSRSVDSRRSAKSDDTHKLDAEDLQNTPFRYALEEFAVDHQQDHQSLQQ